MIRVTGRIVVAIATMLFCLAASAQNGSFIEWAVPTADSLPLHFYLNVVLRSRYGNRFRGKVEALDEVFAQFLGGQGADSVKKLRLFIQQRLGPISADLPA